MESTLSSKNQVTIPKLVREYLNLKPGDRFKYFLQPDGTVAILPLFYGRIARSLSQYSRRLSTNSCCI